MGRGKRYTAADEWIQNFLEQTALPPSGLLQSSSSVGPRLRVDLLSPSDTPVDVGGRPTTRQQEAAVDVTATTEARGAAAAMRRPRLRAAGAAACARKMLPLLRRLLLRLRRLHVPLRLTLLASQQAPALESARRSFNVTLSSPPPYPVVPPHSPTQ